MSSQRWQILRRLNVSEQDSTHLFSVVFQKTPASLFLLQALHACVYASKTGRDGVASKQLTQDPSFSTGRSGSYSKQVLQISKPSPTNSVGHSLTHCCVIGFQIAVSGLSS